MSRSLQISWVLLEVVALLFLVWSLFGLTTWSGVSSEVLNESPDAIYYIRQLISIALMSLGVLIGLGLGAVVLAIGMLRGSHWSGRDYFNVILVACLVLVPVAALIVVVNIGGVI